MACRKNFLDLTNDERDLLAGAFNDLFARGLITTFSDEHEHHFNTGIHRGPAFLPWHRYFLLGVEAEMRKFDSRATIPYWDWTRADSRDLDVEPWLSFFGGRTGRGRFSSWSFTRDAAPAPGRVLPSLDSVIDEARRGTYAEFRGMEFGSHVPGHTWTGGTMESVRSPLDPLFYLHHCNIDRLWAIWQRNHSGVAQYTLDDIPGGICGGVCPRISEAYVPLNDPMIGGATPASMLDHVALGYTYPTDDLFEQRVLARGLPAMASGDPTTINLVTPTVVFNDVPEGDTTRRAALFHVLGCDHVSFMVTAGPTAPFSLLTPGPFMFPSGPLPQSELRIWLLFTGRAPNTSDAGSMTIVAHDEFGGEIGRFDIQIVANSVRRPRAAVALVLDESGSMLAQAGNGRTRIQVLQQAAITLVDHLYDDNGLAIVSFADTAARVIDLQVAGPLNSTERDNARSQIGQHGPPDQFPHTAIGAGIQEAANVYATSPLAPNFDVQSTVVFTDGIEDRAPFIRDLTIGERVYAVGVANAANVANDVLRALAANSGGFMLVTGEIPQDDEFLLEKFFIQILAGVVNRNIVRDPEGVVVPGQIARVPFHLTRSDIEFDALALSRASQFLAIALQTPDGTVVNQTQVPAGGFRTGATSSGYRITLPLVVDGVEHWEGEWQLLLALQFRGAPTHVVTGIAAVAATAALRFHALMHVRSNLRLRATIDQTMLEPGATLHLRAVITEYGQAIETHPMVVSQMKRPDATTTQLGFVETSSGEFETSVVATQSGVYRFLVQASGLSTRGSAFTRESLLTAVIGHRTSQPPGGPDGGPSGGVDWCDVLHCLFDESVMSGRLLRRLEEQGIRVDRLRKCLEELCPRQPPPGPVIK
ncbi:tyrosinase family protein [Microvirga yunnanensis]|uniref:tyrosinase family protein n=1 Tax=Microvirga yunnanensis TaxID=2953740 RepID=UPI0021C6779F|nr:tyrosinase family protein [Microvirga sp. HBU65207]